MTRHNLFSPRTPLYGPLLFVMSIGLLCLALSAQSQTSIRPAASVNDRIVTIYDVVQRVELVLLQSGTPRNALNRRLIAPRVLDALIDEQLQLIEAEKYNLIPDDKTLGTAIVEFEAQQNLPPGTIREQLTREGVDYRTFTESFRANTAWQNIGNEIISPKVSISDAEVEREAERLSALLNRNGASEVRLFMILLSGDNRSPALRQDAAKLLQSLDQGANFSALARQFSTDLSAQFGGDLGWIDPETIEGGLTNWLETATPGAVSPPYPMSGGLAVFKFEDRRRANTENLDRQRIIERIGNRKLQNQMRSLQRTMQQQAIITRMIDL